MEQLYETPKGELFDIDDADKASWAIRKIAQIRAAGREREAFYREQMETAARQTREAEAHLTELLARWFQTVPQRETETQCKVALPDGELVLTRPTPAYERDDATLCAWLYESGQPDLVDMRVVQKVKWAELKKHVLIRGDHVALADTGEIVPGVKVTMQPGSFAVKPREEASA